MTKLLLFIVLNQSVWAGEVNCGSFLSLASLRTSHARFQADLDRLAAPFSDLKIQLFGENFGESVGGLPTIAKPHGSDSEDFRVVIHAHLGDSDYDFATGFSIVPRDGEFALETSVESGPPLEARATLQNLELMSLFVALSATPYSRFLQITQKVDSADYEAFRSIRLSKIQGLSDRLAVRLHWPWLVEALGEDGFPISYNAVKVDALRDDKRKIQPSLPDKADHFLIEYDYLILDSLSLH